jgi:hypothetical protein
VRRETEKLTKALRQHVLTYQVDDQEWDREKAANRAVSRMLNTTDEPRPGVGSI